MQFKEQFLLACVHEDTYSSSWWGIQCSEHDEATHIVSAVKKQRYECSYIIAFLFIYFGVQHLHRHT